MADERGLPPRVENQSSEEFVDDNGVTTPVRMVREAVPPGQDGVDLIWRGEKKGTRHGRGFRPAHQGEHTQVVVPPIHDPDYEPYYHEDDRDQKFPVHTEGTTYNLHRDRPVRVRPDHVDFLLKHPVHAFERVQSAEEKERAIRADERAKAAREKEQTEATVPDKADPKAKK